MAESNTQANEKVGFLEEKEGKASSIRLMSAVALLASITFGLLVILHPVAKDGENGLYITIAFLIAAFAPKAPLEICRSQAL